MYDGTGIAEVEIRTVEIGAHGSDTIEMAGWFVCNGNVSTPNLQYRFIRGNFFSDNVGGSNDAVVVEHNHGASSNNTGAHTHDIRTNFPTTYDRAVDSALSKRPQTQSPPTTATDSQGNHEHVITVSNEGVSGVGKNMPSYYDVIYIIRMN